MRFGPSRFSTLSGLLVHAVTGVQNKKHLIQQRHARGAFRVVNGHVNRGFRLDVCSGCCCADLNVKAGNGVLATGIAPDHEHRLWSGQPHLGMLILTVLWVARMVRRCGQVLVLWDYELAFPDSEACWRLRRAVFHLKQNDFLHSFGFSAFVSRSSIIASGIQGRRETQTQLEATNLPQNMYLSTRGSTRPFQLQVAFVAVSAVNARSRSRILGARLFSEYADLAASLGTFILTSNSTTASDDLEFSSPQRV